MSEAALRAHVVTTQTLALLRCIHFGAITCIVALASWSCTPRVAIPPRMTPEDLRQQLGRHGDHATPKRSLVLDAAQASNRCIGPGGATIFGPLTDAEVRDLNRIVQALRAGPVMEMDGTPEIVRVQTGVGCGMLSGTGQVLLFRRYRGLFVHEGWARWELVFMGDWVS